MGQAGAKELLLGKIIILSFGSHVEDIRAFDFTQWDYSLSKVVGYLRSVSKGNI